MKSKIISILLVLAMVATMALCLTACGSTASIDIDKYVTVDISGYNGYGRAEYAFDSDTFEKDYADSVKYKENNTNSMAVYSLAESIEPCGQFDVDENLSNGDEVTLSWTFNADQLESVYDIKLNYSNIKTTVEGLEDINTIDVFSDASVTFEGIAPNGIANISVDSSYLSASDFTITPSNGLSNGDEVTVEFTGTEAMISQYGAIPVETEKTYTVEGLSYYINSLSDIPDDAMEKMKSQASDAFYAHAAANWMHGTDIIENFEFIGNYFLYPKDSFSTSNHNEIILVYKVNVNIPNIDASGQTYYSPFTYYTYYKFTDGIILQDGTYSMDYSNYTTCSNRIYVTEYDYTQKYTWNQETSAYFLGYEDIDTAFNQLVTVNIENYNYENTVDTNANISQPEDKEIEQDNEGSESSENK